MSIPSRRTSPHRLAFAAITLSAWTALSPARAADLVFTSDCVSQQAEMRARGWDRAEIQKQLNEPNVVGAHRFGEYLEAFRAGLKVAREEGDLESLASLGLGVCAFETASLRSRIASQSIQSSPQGERVAPKTSAAAPVMINPTTAKTGGFVAPPTSDTGQPRTARGSATGAGASSNIGAGPRLAMNGEPLITQDDYPPVSIRLGEHGAVGFSVTVSAAGMPTRCDIIASSGFPNLDSQTCALVLQRARFEPARTASGQAVSATFQQKVRWTLPE
jgi:TonB family protein